MPKLYLGVDFECWYSDVDAPLVEARRWYIHRTASNGRFYACTHIFVTDETGARRRRKVYMHRMITGEPKGFVIDHADRNGLNNRRWNLRKTTGTFNNANADYGTNLCGYRGVSSGGKRTYRARICFGGVDTHIGVFPTAIEAARAYDARAKELFGPFAWLNFNPEMDALREAEAAREAQRARDLEEIPF